MKYLTRLEDDEIIIRLDAVLAFRKMRLKELSEQVGVDVTNLSRFKTGDSRLINISTLMRICKVLECTPNDIFQFSKKGSKPELPAVAHR